MAKALPAWNETEEIETAALPAFDETAAIEPEIMPTDFEAPGKIESVLRGAGQGASLGYSDELIGALEAMLTEKSYEQARNESRAANKAAKDANPATYMGGQVGGSILSALAVPQATAGKLGAVALKMGALGAAQGVGESDADLASMDTAKQAALSGLIGGAFGAGGAKLAKMATSTEALDDLAMSQGRRALGFTKKLQNTPLKEMQADDATRLALDRGILKPFAEPKAMQEGAEGIAKESGEAMGEFLKGQSHGATRALKSGAAPQLREQFLFDPRSAIDELEALRPKGLNMGDNADINAIIDKAINTVKAKGTVNARGDYALRPIPWEEGRALKTQIQGMANYDTAASREVNEMKKRLAGKIRDSFMHQLEETAEARGKSAGFEAFRGNVKDYGSAETLQDALQNRVSSDQGNSVIGLRDAIFGAASLAKDGGNYGKAAMTVALSKVGRRYGNQSISWSADRLSKAIKQSPQVFQKWLPNLRSAMARGPQGLAVTSFILQQSDPDYSETLEKMSEDETR
jgi:hypothetical protein